MAKKRKSETGIWIVLAAIILGSCIVIASSIMALPLYAALASSANPNTELPILPANTHSPRTMIDQVSVEDKREGKTPDFRKLTVGYDADTVYVTIDFASENAGYGTVYLYGTHRDEIKFVYGSFQLRRDAGSDGHFEELVYSDAIEMSGNRMIIQIPVYYLPDIAEKKVWGYSMQSRDRIPDDGELCLSPTLLPQTATVTPAPITSQSSTSIQETFVEDKFEGKSPDFRMLIASYDADTVYITLLFNSGINQIGVADFIYLYGTHHDCIRLGQDTFRLERDGAGDGHFEEVVYSGSIVKIASDTISIEIPRAYIPDIAEKRIWGGSMQSRDRIPDEGALRFPSVDGPSP